MQQTKKFKMADAISPYLAVSCGLSPAYDKGRVLSVLQCALLMDEINKEYKEPT